MLLGQHGWRASRGGHDRLDAVREGIPDRTAFVATRIGPLLAAIANSQLSPAAVPPVVAWPPNGSVARALRTGGAGQKWSIANVRLRAAAREACPLARLRFAEAQYRLPHVGLHGEAGCQPDFDVLDTYRRPGTTPATAASAGSVHQPSAAVPQSRLRREPVDRARRLGRSRGQMS